MNDITIRSGKVDTTPEDARYNTETIRDLDNLFMSLLERRKIRAACYLLAREGKVFVHKAMGQLKYNDPGSEFQTDSLRMIASITKVFTAVAVMQLIEQGLLYLEQPVAAIIKEFDTPMHNGINLFHLMTHTSGLPAEGGYFCEPYPYWREITDMDDLIHLFLEGPLRFKPGKIFAYSTLGYCILGEIIKRVSGMSYEKYIQQNLFEPLGMKDSFFKIPRDMYNRVCIVNKEEEEKSYKRPEEFFFNAGGGITSTAYDLFRFGQMMLNKGTYNNARILGRKTVEAMTRNRLEPYTPAFYWGRDVKEWEYGIGFDIAQGNMVSPGTIDHEGAGRSALYIDPSENFIAVYVVPTTIDWDAEYMENPRSVMWSGIL
ncbi:MAG: beta-lactamase family protein [Spirochaetales bacterium]|nr:beta-lactamase family protein [Spirochaetales bacterium]